MKSVNLAILGLGTVGAGALRLLQDNAAEITRRTGREIRITHVGSRRPRPDLQLDGIVCSEDLLSIVRHAQPILAGESPMRRSCGYTGLARCTDSSTVLASDSAGR